MKRRDGNPAIWIIWLLFVILGLIFSIMGCDTEGEPLLHSGYAHEHEVRYQHQHATPHVGGKAGWHTHTRTYRHIHQYEGKHEHY